MVRAGGLLGEGGAGTVDGDGYLVCPGETIISQDHLCGNIIAGVDTIGHRLDSRQGRFFQDCDLGVYIDRDGLANALAPGYIDPDLGKVDAVLCRGTDQERDGNLLPGTDRTNLLVVAGDDFNIL